MAVTVSGTSITFNDGTVQTTAATGASTDFGSVGSYAVLMMAANTNLSTGSTIAGSSLRYNATANQSQSSNATVPFTAIRFRSNSSSFDGGGTALAGTWRKMSTGATFIVFPGCGVTDYQWYQALYVRIS